VLVVGGAGADAAAKFVDACGLPAKAAAKVAGRLASVKDVAAVADDAAAAAALGL